MEALIIKFVKLTFKYKSRNKNEKQLQQNVSSDAF